MKDLYTSSLEKIAKQMSGADHLDGLAKSLWAERHRVIDHNLASELQALEGMRQYEASTVVLYHRELLDVMSAIDMRKEVEWLHGQVPPEMLDAAANAIESARLAGALNLPDALERYRLSDTALSSQIVEAKKLAWFDAPRIAALNSHAAMSDLLDTTKIIGHGTLSAVNEFLSEPSYLHSVRQVSQLMEVSKLLRLPRYRILTRDEKAGRIRVLVKNSAPSAHARRAHSFIHRYESVLRFVLADCMERAYGEDWAASRLPLCGCKNLLGKGKTLDEGETILDRADFTHYANIMCDSEHFDNVFSAGFDDPEELRQMIIRVGNLRARSHHARTFTPEHYRELVTLLRTIEAGLSGLIEEIEIDL